MLIEQLDKLKTFNWKVGIQVRESGSKANILLSLNRILRFERLERKDSVDGIAKLLSEKERYSSDVKLDSGDWTMFPLK